MADTAILVRYDVGWTGLRILAGRGNTVVAGIASLTHNIRTGVIDEGIDKTGGIVAHTAVTAGVAMNRSIRRSRGANRGVTSIMARDTIAVDTGVRES